MSLDLDYKNKRILQLSSVAFNYIYFDEAPEDGTVLKEVDDLNDAFELGFYIVEYDYLPDSFDQIVQIVLIPYVESGFNPNMIITMFNGWSYECEINETRDMIKYRKVHTKSGPRQVVETTLQVNEFGNEFFIVGNDDNIPEYKFHAGHNSMFFTKGKDAVHLKK